MNFEFEDVLKIKDVNIKINYLRKFRDRLISKTSFLPIDSSISERVYCIDNNIFKRPDCKYCKGKVKYIKYGKGYSVYCSKKCSNSCNERINNMKLTNIKRYGVESFMSTIDFREKSKENLLLKYGVDNYTKTDEYKIKYKKTCFDKYGVDNVSKYDFFKYKRIETCNIKYGVDYPNQNELVRYKYVSTCLDKYGVDNVSKLKEINDKKSKSFIENNLKYDLKSKESFVEYRRLVNNLTKRNKKTILENWDGYDYYDNEFIKDNYSIYNSNHNNYPSIDHKISVYEGFINKIDPLIISDISNLCITKRSINSKKNKINESNFRL